MNTDVILQEYKSKKELMLAKEKVLNDIWQHPVQNFRILYNKDVPIGMNSEVDAEYDSFDVTISLGTQFMSRSFIADVTTNRRHTKSFTLNARMYIRHPCMAISSLYSINYHELPVVVQEEIISFIQKGYHDNKENLYPTPMPFSDNYDVVYSAIRDKILLSFKQGFCSTYKIHTQCDGILQNAGDYITYRPISDYPLKVEDIMDIDIDDGVLFNLMLNGYKEDEILDCVQSLGYNSESCTHSVETDLYLKGTVLEYIR